MTSSETLLLASNRFVFIGLSLHPFPTKCAALPGALRHVATSLCLEIVGRLCAPHGARMALSRNVDKQQSDHQNALRTGQKKV